ncbi:hypothetical protein BU14_0535s0007 [Porphyra umbilicalis]|uniref:Lipocalin/cytosolic fatty-acid binding domain-containing protein n=1 Tax=Porphyra umbilicalis TaxID=2786 RepID=A0A1X6NSC6_PORUM|nr:hypothetical protein BU14_0535s0007 [Porphyra umbilicalis]|eukprot:OSX71430.1 hypothetical protein BU14_0535s0007 [Porphyra umbilicalis]
MAVMRCTLVLLAVTAAAAASGAAGTPPPTFPHPPLTACPNPSTVRALDVSAYAGRWYQAAVSARFAARSEANAPCVTADYTVNGSTIEVVNCKQEVAATASTPATVGCTRGVAFPPPPGGDPGKLSVQFPVMPAPGPYWVVDLVGRASAGYHASVVYSCVLRRGVPVQDLFILSRTPRIARHPRRALSRLYWRVMKKGVLLERDNALTVTKQGKRCAYRGDPGVKVVIS